MARFIGVEIRAGERKVSSYINLDKILRFDEATDGSTEIYLDDGSLVFISESFQKFKQIIAALNAKQAKKPLAP